MNYVFCKPIILGELDAIRIEHPLFNTTLLLQGAQLIEFCPISNQFNNLLWLSDTAEYKHGQSIRGGIPICWPWFGSLDKNSDAIQQQVSNPDSASAHGFARNLDWKINSIHEDCHFVQIDLELRDNSESKKLWPFEFNLIARFTFSETLEVELITTNLDKKEMMISQAMHTYLPTTDITQTYIYQSKNTFKTDTFYIDAMDNWKEKKQIGRVAFNKETDRLYFFSNKNQQDHYQLRVESPNQQIMIKNENSNSAVIWNPWINKSLRLSQFKADDYKTMFCIETANVMQDSKILAHQEQHHLKLTLSTL